MALILESPSFDNGGPIPREHARDFQNTSPPLRWRGEPEGTKSFVLVVEDPDAPDPDAPKRVWVHWVVFNLPPAAHELPADASRRGLPRGADQGLNDWSEPAWGGPQPPIGRHRYFFRLWALDTQLPARHYRRSEIEAAIEGHVLDSAELMGTFDARTAGQARTA